jgi:hypothetical protein
MQWNRPEGTQVVMATAETLEDENIENRPKTQNQSNDRMMPPAGIGSITLLQGTESEDEDEEEIETFRASAARIDRPQKTDEKWKNPTKIMKKPKPIKERKLAVPKTMRSGNWRPAFVTDETERTEGTERTEEMETDRMKNDDDAVLVRVEDNPEKKRKLRTPRKKYLDIIKENTNPEAVFDEVMKQPVTIKLQDLLACSPTFAKLLFKSGISPKEEISMPSAKVGSIGLRHQHQEKTYAAKTSKLSVKVNGTTTQAMLDTGAEVNVITCSAAEELGLPIRTDLLLALKAVSGDTRVFDRACEDVEIDIGGVVNHQTLLVLNNSKHTLILGAPFFHDAQVTFDYNDDGYQYARILSEDREKVATVQVCIPQGKSSRASSEDPELSGND